MLIVTVNGEGLEEEEDEEHPHNSSGNRKTDKKRYRVFMGGLSAFPIIMFRYVFRTDRAGRRSTLTGSPGWSRGSSITHR